MVTLAEAVPCPGSGITLPLDLHRIASRCTNSYYASRRFAAVQLAFSAPRARVLVFHTGRVVGAHVPASHAPRRDRHRAPSAGTGCSGQMEARLSILRAQRQLAQEAGMKLHIRAFQVINQVAAVALDARLDCEAFATTHSATSHYDRQARPCVPASLRPCVPASLRPCVPAQSFVGLAWRPVAEPICCEIYSTGRANLVRRPPSRRRARPG